MPVQPLSCAWDPGRPAKAYLPLSPPWWVSTSAQPQPSLGPVGTQADGTQVLIQRASAPGGQAPCSGLVDLPLAECWQQEPQDNVDWTRRGGCAGRVIPRPGLEGQTQPKGTDRAAKSQHLRNPERVELVQGPPGARRQQGAWKGERMGAKQDEKGSSLRERAGTQPPARYAFYRDPEVPTGEGREPLRPPKSKFKGQVWHEVLDSPRPGLGWFPFSRAFYLLHPYPGSRLPEPYLSLFPTNLLSVIFMLGHVNARVPFPPYLRLRSHLSAGWGLFCPGSFVSTWYRCAEEGGCGLL